MRSPLLLRNFDPNVTDDHGDTPLHYATRSPETWWVDELRELGAQELANHDGQTPSDLIQGQLTIDVERPAGVGHVGRAELEASLFQGALSWEINISGFGLELPSPAADRAEPDWTPIREDFRLYNESISSLKGKLFEKWHDLFAKPLPIDRNSGDSEYAALYVYAHGSVEGSFIECSDFTSTGCRMVWAGEQSDFGKFRCETAIKFTGIGVSGTDGSGRHIQDDPAAVAEALRPHVAEFDTQFEVVRRPHPLRGFWAVPIP